MYWLTVALRKNSGNIRNKMKLFSPTYLVLNTIDLKYTFFFFFQTMVSIVECQLKLSMSFWGICCKICTWKACTPIWQILHVAVPVLCSKCLCEIYSIQFSNVIFILNECLLAKQNS